MFLFSVFLFEVTKNIIKKFIRMENGAIMMYWN